MKNAFNAIDFASLKKDIGGKADDTLNDVNTSRDISTHDIFGERLHSYTIKDAIGDGNVLGFDVSYYRPDYIITNQDPNFTEKEYDKVFVKSSTGFYKTPEGVPNGATVATIKLMLENSFPLLVKAAGGVRTYEEAVEMVQLGVKRIGTSAAKAIATGEISNSDY